MADPVLTREFLRPIDQELRDALLSIKHPLQIQELLDSIPYIGEDLNRTPQRVLMDWQCHCLDGGMLAALLLRHLGYAPLLVDLIPAPDVDDDHVLAVFKVNGLWGSVAKSNFTGLRYRDPLYRSLRELAMSYYESFFNIQGQKTLRGYSRAFNLSHYDNHAWMTDQAGSAKVVEIFYARKWIPLFPNSQLEWVSDLDKRSYENGFMGVNREELFKLKPK